MMLLLLLRYAVFTHFCSARIASSSLVSPRLKFCLFFLLLFLLLLLLLRLLGTKHDDSDNANCSLEAYNCANCLLLKQVIIIIIIPV